MPTGRDVGSDLGPRRRHGEGDREWRARSFRPDATGSEPAAVASAPVPRPDRRAGDRRPSSGRDPRGPRDLGGRGCLTPAPRDGLRPRRPAWPRGGASAPLPHRLVARSPTSSTRSGSTSSTRARGRLACPSGFEPDLEPPGALPRRARVRGPPGHRHPAPGRRGLRRLARRDRRRADCDSHGGGVATRGGRRPARPTPYALLLPVDRPSRAAGCARTARPTARYGLLTPPAELVRAARATR